MDLNYKINTINGVKVFSPTAIQMLYMNASGDFNIISRLTRQQGYSLINKILAIEICKESNKHVKIIDVNNKISVGFLSDIHSILKLNNIDILYYKQNRIVFKNGSSITITSIDNYNNSIIGMRYSDIISMFNIRVDNNNIDSLSSLIEVNMTYNIKLYLGLMNHEINPSKEYSRKLKNIFSMVLNGDGVLIDFCDNNKYIDLYPDKSEFELFDIFN